jgi:hypothetical protein
MTVGDISSHLLADWVPSLPAAIGSSFIGWPPFLFELTKHRNNDVLAIRPEVGRSERQWKSVLSWMVGVAGARHILASEGYRWIAPLSAFYPEAVQLVDLSTWNPSFPPSSVTASRPLGSRHRLRPDYLALRSTAATQTMGQYEWAVAEAKGTRRCLTNLKMCPTAWSNQARNVTVKVDGSEVTIPRHLVIATRLNPTASSSTTRRMQIRAWNRRDEPREPAPSPEAALEIVAAH